MRGHAKVVIIGGGIMGCSLAYHLCKEGLTDLVLVEKGELTSGSTWHAAGQITHSVSHYGLAKMVAYGTELYSGLEETTGKSATWHGCGSLRLAYEDDEIDALHYTVSMGRGIGLEMEIVGKSRIAELHPFYCLDGIKAALHTPHDGHMDPAGTAFALAHGARQMGAEIVRKNRVTGVEQRDGGEWRIHTEQGDIDCEIVVNAGGTYARQIGKWFGLDLPVANMLHHYLITNPVPEFQDLETELPVIRDDRNVSGYIRMEQKCGLVGIYEKAGAKSVWDGGTPWDVENHLFDADYDRIMPWLKNAMQRMPIFSEIGIKRVVHGAITHPADGNMLLGPAGVRNVWICGGASVGIAWGAGAGKYLAQWMVHGSADISMASFDPRRFGARIDDEYAIGKGKEDYLLRHEIPFPHLDKPACRPSHSKTTPLYGMLAEKGAVYQEAFGWERPFWYATGDVPREHVHTFRRSAVMHDAVRSEVEGMRRSVGIADLSAFAKVEVHGSGAEEYLDRIASNRLPQRTGSISLTYLVNPSGRIEGEMTVMRLSGDRYYLVYAATKELALLDWMKGQTRNGEQVGFDNVSDKCGVLMVAGPEARNLLSQTTDATLDNSGFRWLSGQRISVAGVENVRAMRVTYTGELGWELHVPMEAMLQVYTQLVSAGEHMDLVHVGSACLNAMRMEKGYKSGHEITSEVTLAEADLARFSRKKGFQGAEKSLRPPSRWKIALLRLEEPSEETVADPIGNESVWKGTEHVGFVTSGGYGYSLGAWLGWAYVRPESSVPETRLEIAVLGEVRQAKVVEGVPFDPGNERAKA